MTVQELLDVLNQAQDKSIEVYYGDPATDEQRIPVATGGLVASLLNGPDTELVHYALLF